MPATTVTLDTADGPMPTYQATPEGVARGGVVVIQEAYGCTNYLQDVCRRFADAGWAAVAPALYHRDGSPTFAVSGDSEHIMLAMSKLTASGIATDLDAALAQLASLGFGPQRTAIVGFCLGGTIAVFAAQRLALGAAVTLYSSGLTEGRVAGYPGQVDVAPELQTPWIGLYGDLDKTATVEDVERLRLAAAQSRVPTEVVIYPGADHGFHNETRTEYNQAAAAAAWERTLAWLDQHVSAA